jgi:hypothetical protein
MAYTVSKIEVWTGSMEDQVGGLAAKLEPFADAGVNLEMIIARRQPSQPGRGVVFLGPLSGAKGQKAAQAAGLSRAEWGALRVEGRNVPGDAHRLVRALADAGLNLRGFSATGAGTKMVAYVAFDSKADADQAAKILRAAKKK